MFSSNPKVHVLNPDNPDDTQYFALLINHALSDTKCVRIKAPRSAQHKSETTKLKRKKNSLIYTQNETGFRFTLPGDLVKVKIKYNDVFHDRWILCGRRLGKGVYGTVYSVSHLLDSKGNVLQKDTKLAIKKLPYSIKKTPGLDESRWSQLLTHERGIICSLTDIPPYEIENELKRKTGYLRHNSYGLYDSKRAFTLLREYPGESLDECDLKRLTWLERINLAKSIIDAVKEFHTKSGYVHSDLKPSNILFDKTTGTVSIIDYGLSKRVDTACEIASGTPLYSPPEAFGAYTYQYSFDTFSLAPILAMVFTGNTERVSKSRNCTSNNYNFSWIDESRPKAKEIKNFINIMQSQNPNDRPNDKQMESFFSAISIEGQIIDSINRISDKCESHLEEILSKEAMKLGITLDKTTTKNVYEDFVDSINQSTGDFASSSPHLKKASGHLKTVAKSYKQIRVLRSNIDERSSSDTSPLEKLQNYKNSFRQPEITEVFRSNPDSAVRRFFNVVGYHLANIFTLGLVDILNKRSFITTPQERFASSVDKRLRISEHYIRRSNSARS